MDATIKAVPAAGRTAPERRIAVAVRQLKQISGVRSIGTDLPLDSLEDVLMQLSDAAEEVTSLTDELRQQNQELARAAIEAVSKEARYRELFDLAPVPYVVTDAQGIIWQVNASAEVFLGARHGVLVGSPLIVHVAPPYRPAFATLLRALRHDSEPAAPRFVEMRAVNGTVLPATVSVSVTQPAEHERAGLRWTLHDLTDRLRVEEMQGRLAAIIESSQDAVIGATREGIISSWNPAAVQLFGSSAEEAMGRPLWVFAPPEFVALEQGYVARLLAGERVARYETVRVRKDGTRVRVMMTLSPVRNRVGELIGVSAAVQDLSANELANERLRESERHYRLLVETVKVGICAADNKGRMSFVNPHMAEMLGYTVDEMLGEGSAGFFEDPSGLSLGTAANDGWTPVAEDRSNPGARDMRLRRKDGGQVDVSISMSPLYDRHGQRRGSLAGVTDLTERIRTEEASRKASIRAEEENSAKAMVLATMSHELRAPLSAICGLAELLVDTELSEDQEELVGLLKQRSDDLRGVINSVLDMAVAETGVCEAARRPIELADALRHAIATVEMSAGVKRVRITQRVAQDVPARVFGDGQRLKQVLVNLLVNAVKFTSQGSIHVSVDRHGPASPRGEGLLLEFVVRDTGQGIRQDQLQAVFETFVHLDVAGAGGRDGTGLGLSISKQLVERMGGRIWVESEPGHGSAFHFTVRVGADSGSTRPPPHASPAKGAGEGR